MGLTEQGKPCRLHHVPCKCIHPSQPSQLSQSSTISFLSCCSAAVFHASQRVFRSSGGISRRKRSRQDRLSVLSGENRLSCVSILYRWLANRLFFPQN